MSKIFLDSKIHNIRVTHKSVDYQGSVSIDSNLLAQAKIELYQQVQIINLNNGNRWETYVIGADSKVFSLNGGGARLGEIGDRCVVLSYAIKQSFENASVIYCDVLNQVEKSFKY